MVNLFDRFKGSTALASSDVEPLDKVQVTVEVRLGIVR